MFYMKVVTILYPMNKLHPIPPKKARALAGCAENIENSCWESNTKYLMLCLMIINEDDIM